MKHYNLKYNQKIIKQLIQDGFSIKYPGKNKNKFQVFHDTKPRMIYTIHSGGKNPQNLRRFLRENFNYELDLVF